MGNSALNHRFGCGGPSNDPANRATAADLAALYSRVADGSLLTSADRDQFLSTMIDDARLLPERAAAETHVYLKDGIYGNTRTIAFWSSRALLMGLWPVDMVVLPPKTMRPSGESLK